MPIRISHQPPAAVIGGASYIGGLGQFQQRQQELAQRDLQQRRAIEAQQQAMLFGAQQDAIQRQQQVGMFAAEQQARNQQLGMQREWELQDQGAQGFQQSEDDRRAFITQQYKSGEWKLDDASSRKLTEIRNGISAVRSDPKLHPHERQAKLLELDGQWWDIMGNPAPKMPGEEEIPWSEEVKGMTAMEPVISPDGEFMGYNHITRTMRNGEVTPQTKFVPYKPEIADPLAATKNEAAMQKAALETETKQREALQKERDTAQERYRATIMALLKDEIPDGMDADGNTKTRRRTMKEAMKEAKELEAAVDAMVPELPDAAKPPLPGIAGQLQQGGSFNANPLAEQPMEQPLPEPQSPWQQPTQQPSPPNVGPLPPDARPPGPPGEPRVFVPEQVAQMPHPATPAEAAALPSGTLFVTPDGVVMEAP